MERNTLRVQDESLFILQVHDETVEAEYPHETGLQHKQRRARSNNQRHFALQTPEQVEERRRRLRESQRRHLARQTPEQAEERRRRVRESKRRHFAQETPEQAEERRRRARESKRRCVARQTPEQAALYRLRDAERKRLTVGRPKRPLTEEEAAERRRRNRERKRVQRERQRFLNNNPGHTFVINYRTLNEGDVEKQYCDPCDARCQSESPVERGNVTKEENGELPIMKLSEDETMSVEAKESETHRKIESSS